MAHANAELRGIDDDGWVMCSCCGKGIRHNAAENVSFGESPYPHDNGVGMCRECGGDDRVKPVAKKGRKAKPLSEAAVRKRMGFGACCFVDARIEILEKRLNPENLARFNAMPYEKKARVVYDLVEKGAMI